MQIHLKKGEKIYINGAVIKADQRCSFEFLNNVTFLLENHVMQADKADTPLKQVYFVVQSMLIEPENAQNTRDLYWHLSGCMQAATQNAKLIEGLRTTDTCIKNLRYYEALKIMRGLFEIEENLLGVGKPAPKKPSNRKEVA